MEYKNPKMVVVVIQPVDFSDHILLVKRNIEPGKGKLALPGGYMEYETWEETAAREFKEETGIDSPGKFEILFLTSTPDRSKLLLLFVRCTEKIKEESVENFVSTDEVSELSVCRVPNMCIDKKHVEFLIQNLAFPLHLEAILR